MADLRQGEIFAGYRIERRIGGGGMGVVYEALETALDRRVALKLIATDAARDPAFRERFAAESRIAARVEHPNVVPIYAVGEADGVPFLAMRLVPGPNLSETIASLRHLEPADAAAIVSKVAAGLGAIHDQGLIHRDVKPANVLLSGPGTQEEVYVTDFGVAKQAAQTSELTSGGQVLGTLDYVAPELIEGGRVDARSDIYALGCVLYKALTGEVPFPGEDPGTKLWGHVNLEPPLPSRTVGVSEAFDEVVTRALAKDPARRYPTAADFGRAANAAARGSGSIDPSDEPVTEPATIRLASGAVPGSRPPSPRHRTTGRWGFLPGVLVAAAVGVGAFFLARDSGDGASEATQRFTERADSICVESRRGYAKAAARQPSTREAAIEQTEALQRIASRSLRRLQTLRPPAELARDYRIYLAQRQLMVYQLGQAKRAVSRGDVAGLRTAFARIDAQQPLRRESAEEIGLERCSGTG